VEVRYLLELVGVLAPEFDIEFFKTTIWMHPHGLDSKAKLVLKMCLKYKTENGIESEESGKVQIFFKRDSKLSIEEIYDERNRLNQEYLTKMGSKYRIGNSSNKKEKEVSEVILVENIPPNVVEEISSRTEDKEFIRVELKLKPFSRKGTGIMLISMIVSGKIVEKESILKRLIGISRFAWRFQYKLWSHKESIPLFAKGTIHECGEAQIYVIIPKKFFISKGHISLTPGGDQMHTIGKSDIDLLTKFSEEDRRKEDLKWTEKGSCGISWGGSTNVMSLSREVCIEHLEAFPRATTVFFLFSFWVAIATALGIIYYEGKDFAAFDLLFPGLVFVGSSISLYFFINLRNYSFYELGFPSLARTLQGIFRVIAICFVTSAAVFSSSLHELTESWESVLPLVLLASIFALGFFVLANEMRIEPKGPDWPRKKSRPFLTALFFLTITFVISFLFSWTCLESEGYLSKLLTFWMFNNFASLGVLRL
jgi:hypothetical protein